MRPATKQNAAFGVVLFALIYMVVGRIGLDVDAVNGYASLVWPPTGLALGALLLFGYRFWPGILIGATVVNLSAGAPGLVAIGIAIGNTLEALLGAYVMRRYGGFCGRFDRVGHVITLIFGAAVVSTLTSATIGVASITVAGIIHGPHEVTSTWLRWWLGDGLGALLAAPLVLTWCERGAWTRPKPWWRIVEAVALFAFIVGLNVYAFFRPFGEADPLEFPYVLFPLLVWAALRFEMRGATAATAITAVLAVWGTTKEYGPFARESLESALLSVQLFMGCAALTPLVVAGALMERARAVRERDTFLATVSHDLKNPLNSLLVSSEVLLQRMPHDRIKRHHQVIQRSVDRMMRLISDLLDASAIERGQLGVKRKTEDIRVLASEAVELFRPLAPGKTLALEPGESIEVECDRERVLQVLSNIIGNAIKFSPDGATIRVHAGRIQRAACLSVHDDGPGIERDDLPLVFDRYWHTRSVGGGTGLGLFIAKGIVEAHGGRIWVESTPRAGSTFIFTLPAGDEAPVTKRSAKAAAAFFQWMKMRGTEG